MARKQPDPQIRIEEARIENERMRITESAKTQRFFIGCCFGTISLGIIAWAAVWITDKPAWLTFGLALLAAVTPPSGYLLINRRKIARLIADFRAYAEIRAQEEAENTEQQEQLPPGDSDGP